METNNIIVADLGGTYIRFAIACNQNGRIRLFNYKKILSKSYSSFQEALLHYMDFLINEKMQSTRTACFAVAGPVFDLSSIKLTNLPWSISIEEIYATGMFDSVSLINDVEAFAYSLPLMKEVVDLSSIKYGLDSQDLITSFISIGTGFGSSVYIPESNLVIPSEFGNTVLGCYNETQAKLLHLLRQDCNVPRVEDFFSGQGLFSMYKKWCSMYNKSCKYSDINNFVDAMHYSDADLANFLELYLTWLASLSADICLAQGSRKIVFGGGLLLKLINQFDIKKCFQQGFLYSKKMQHLQKDIPIFFCKNDYFPLLGAAKFKISAQ